MLFRRILISSLALSVFPSSGKLLQKKSVSVNVLFGVKINMYIFGNVLGEENTHVSEIVLMDIICTEGFLFFFFFYCKSHTQFRK